MSFVAPQEKHNIRCDELIKGHMEQDAHSACCIN